ncbi:MAG TPA: hypothetical protein EYN66_11940 [Myxococcales bacterium]|nr:hypothetical protein [Myxococcales bacterium]
MADHLTLGEACVYRNEAGLGCAIGCLLTGIPIDDNDNNCSILELIESNHVVQNRLEGLPMQYLEDLQNLHDDPLFWNVLADGKPEGPSFNDRGESWAKGMASQYGLDMPPKETP